LPLSTDDCVVGLGRNGGEGRDNRVGEKTMIIDFKIRYPIVVEVEVVNVVRSDHDMRLGVDDFGLSRLR
jgi:hypothetical protein